MARLASFISVVEKLVSLNAMIHYVPHSLSTHFIACIFESDQEDTIASQCCMGPFDGTRAAIAGNKHHQRHLAGTRKVTQKVETNVSNRQ